MVSVVIPSRNEPYLQNTINSLLENAHGEVEVIVNLDGYWPDPPIHTDSRVKLIHHGTAIGMRGGINACVEIAKGEYILKCDAHTMWADGWDEVLTADCNDNWVVVPRRKRLDAENWAIQELGKPDIDYHYLSFPDDPKDYGGPGLNGKPWNELNRISDFLPEIDDLMSSQGSAWFMKRAYFYELELMNEDEYGKFWNEAQEIMLKAWLSGGRCIVNKKTWYAHLHKGKKHGRGYHLPEEWLQQGRAFTSKWLTDSAWHKQTLPLSWLIEKFWPIPGWPEDWRQQLGYTATAGVPQSNQPKKIFAKQLSYTPTVFTPPIVKKNFKRWKDLPKYLNELGLTKGAEIGVSGGRFSKQLCSFIKGCELLCVDPYSMYEGYKWGGRQERHDTHYAEAVERLKPFNAKVIADHSENVVRDIPDESLDFVYIDGNHDFDHTMFDLIMWGKKVRKGGVIAGDDYFEFRHGGVYDAVNIYVKAHNIREWFVTDEDRPNFFWVKQ